MCGICGFVKLTDPAAKYIGETYIQKMNELMIHRGPDGGGIWLDALNRAGLGHRRLAIIDLSEKAGQPMENEDGTVVISFNGEIYNHMEIRRELERLGGHTWKTDHSDTEVILHAYEQWGMDCLEKFRGMFAFALWDAKKETLFLVRDRMGIKPLYYTVENGVLTFASEIKAILQVLDRTPGINEYALYDYLSFLVTPGEHTLFDGIYKLRPGTYLRIAKDGISPVRYWDVWDHTRSEIYTASEQEIKEQLLAELQAAVDLRKESDVPVGVFLSGGIDSSTNAALFSRGMNGGVKTFCIGYDRDYQYYKNETNYARMMADYCGATYHERLLGQSDLMEFLSQMVWLQDEPIADSVCVPVYYVSKLARDNGVIVSQVGEGSDELFWGYETWKEPLKLAKLNGRFPFRGIKKLSIELLRRADHSNSIYFEYLRRASIGQPVFWSGADTFMEEEKRKLLSAELCRRLDGYTSFEAIRPAWENFKSKAWEKSHLNWMSYAELCNRLPELLLMRVDKMSMGVSLECRVPFLDHKFVELAMSIPEKVKTKNGVSKYILKETVRGVIPDELIDRKKQGFGVPIAEWMQHELGSLMRKEVGFFAKETGLVDMEYVDGLFRRYERRKLWCLFNLALWWKTFLYHEAAR